MILQAALPAVLSDQAGELLAGQAGHLDQVTPHQPLVGLFQAAVAQASEGVGDEGVSLLPVRDVKLEGLATVQKGADLIQSGNV